MTKLQDFLNTPIANVTKGRRPAKPGDLFGIELECEGRSVSWDGKADALLASWAPHADGSLRNHHGDSCEWVFNGPVKYEASVKRVNELFDYFDNRKSKLVCSNRTSTHIHYNMGDKTCYQLVNMFILFTIFEGLLDRYCGEDRAGNLFCLSSRHAQDQIEWMNDVVFKYHNFANMRDDWRYCSFNFASINKFTTVEFRGMRGLDKRQDLLDWLNIINEFCDYASYKMKNPIDVLQAISNEGASGFLAKVFTKNNVKLLTEGLSEHEISASMYEGLRLVQMLAYRVGTEFDQVRLRGRDFWASFNNDAQPELDIDPQDIQRRGVLDPFIRAGRGRPGRARPVEGAEAIPLGGFDDQPVQDDFDDAAVRILQRERERILFRAAQPAQMNEQEFRAIWGNAPAGAQAPKPRGGKAPRWVHEPVPAAPAPNRDDPFDF